MNGIQSSYAIGIVLCLFSAGVLSGTVDKGGRALRHLTLYLALESLCFVLEFLVAHPTTPLKALWLGSLMATSFLVAPCLWLAIRENVEGVRPSLASLRWKERAVIAAGALLTVPLIAAAHFGPDFHDPNRVTPTLFEPAIHETMLICIGLFALQVPWYLSRCRKLLLRGSPALSQSDARWLQWPLIVVGTTWLLGIARTLVGALTDAEPQFFALAALADVGMTVGAVYFIVRRRIASEIRASDTSTRSETESKYAKSLIDQPVRARILTKLTTAFGAEKIHTDSALSLRSLSARLKENEHYVSQVINQDLHTSFYELLNRHRIEHAKQLLLESPQQNVLDIALAVGFNAKSTFNSAFRRLTNMTPREFRSARLPGMRTRSSNQPV